MTGRLAVVGLGPGDPCYQTPEATAALNRAMAFAFDMMGASSYIWHWKHNVLHHGFTNIPGVDDDINLAGIGRMARSASAMPSRWRPASSTPARMAAA